MIHLISNPEDDVEAIDPCSLPLICRSAMSIILGIGDHWWRTCETAAKNNTIPLSLNYGNTNARNKEYPALQDELHLYFSDILSMCDVIPTRFVRQETGKLTLRDNNDCMQLPPYWSKHNLYS
jgi:hypothetical protein